MMNSFIFISKSPWPIMITINITSMIMILTSSMYFKMNLITLISTMLTTLNIIMWMTNSIKSKSILGMKNLNMNLSMKMMIINLIASEMMFFSTFFYINLSMNTFNNINLNFKNYINMFKLNLILSSLNLLILLTSSMTMMMFINMMNMKKIKSINMLKLTIKLSTYFILIQMFEYLNMPLNLTNSIFMSNFFSLTMFHMMHVIMGSLYMMLMIKSVKTLTMVSTIKSSIMCWYWHFIDIIWIIIFVLIY